MNLSQLCASLERHILDNAHLSSIVGNVFRLPTRGGGAFIALAQGNNVDRKFTDYQVHFGFVSDKEQDLGSMNIAIKTFSTAEVTFTNSYKRDGKPGIVLHLKRYFREDEMTRLLISKITYLSLVPNAYQRDDSVHVMLSPTEQIINAVREMVSVFGTVMHLLEHQQKTA